jgi:hypothetical protein
MKNNLLFNIIICTTIFSSCRSYERKIIGKWEYIEIQRKPLSKEEEKVLIAECQSNSRNVFGNIIIYDVNFTFLIDYECYNELGTYKIKNDTLYETYYSNREIDIYKYLILGFRNNLMIVKNSDGEYMYLWKLY